MAKSENVYRSRKKMLFDNFLGGIFWSIGVWIGTTFIIAFIVFLFGKVNLVPMVGDFVADVMKYIDVSNDPFQNIQ